MVSTRQQVANRRAKWGQMGAKLLSAKRKGVANLHQSARLAAMNAGRWTMRRAVGGAINKMYPYAGAAYKGAKLAYGAYKLYQKYKGKKGESRLKTKLYHTTGAYGGKVKLSRSGLIDSFARYNVNGVVMVDETTGSVTDPDCIYIMNEAINSRDLIWMICKAMVRKLFEKAGIRITGAKDPVIDISGGQSTPNFTVRLVTVNKFTGAWVNTDYTLIATSTFEDVAGWFRNNFEQYCSGHGELSNSNMDELHKFILLKGTAANLATNHDSRSELLFNETFIDIYGLSELKFQNRTKATGGGVDAEDINNNPLVGKSYLFRGVPKPKANAWVVGGTNSALFAFERMQYNRGLVTFGGNSGGFDPQMREPPSPSMFWNCVKAGKVRVEPGEIKKFVSKDFRSGNVLKILKNIRLQLDAGGGWSTYSIFKVQMIALEDVINANAAENISVQYECQRQLGVKCWSKQKKFYRTEYIQVT